MRIFCFFIYLVATASAMAQVGVPPVPCETCNDPERKVRSRTFSVTRLQSSPCKYEACSRIEAVHGPVSIVIAGDPAFAAHETTIIDNELEVKRQKNLIFPGGSYNLMSTYGFGANISYACVRC